MSIAPVRAQQLVDETPEELKNVGVAERLNEQVPLDLPFVDSDGREVQLTQFFDGKRPVILTMNYSACPRLCSLQLNGLLEGLRGLDWNIGDKFQMITVSIDHKEEPYRSQDTKDKYLKEYDRAGSADGWHFLTGREENIRKLADAVGFRFAYVEETKEYAHAAVTMICTPDGRVSRYLYGIEYKPPTLRLSLLEAGEGKIGTTADRIMLYCLRYDASSNSYAWAAVKVMRIGALMTIVLLGGTLLAFWGREFKHAKKPPSTTVQS